MKFIDLVNLTIVDKVLDADHEYLYPVRDKISYLIIAKLEDERRFNPLSRITGSAPEYLAKSTRQRWELKTIKQYDPKTEREIEFKAWLFDGEVTHFTATERWQPWVLYQKSLLDHVYDARLAAEEIIAWDNRAVA